MTKSFATNAQEALAAAAAAASRKMASREPTQPTKAAEAGPPRAPKVQFNVLLTPEARKKLRSAAFAWNTSERELLEAFIAQLPDVEIPEVAVPQSVSWVRAKA